MTRMREAKLRNGNYNDVKEKKEIILERLKAKGCRITKQRRILIDIVLQGDCECCKDIYYRALKLDPSIGLSTVYRMMNMLEEIEVINPKNMYHISCSRQCQEENMCLVELDDQTFCRLSTNEWRKVVSVGLKSLGYTRSQKALNVVME